MVVEDTISSCDIQKHLGEAVSATFTSAVAAASILGFTLLFEDESSQPQTITLHIPLALTHLSTWLHKKKRQRNNEKAPIANLRGYGEPGELCTRWSRTEYAPEVLEQCLLALLTRSYTGL